MKIISQFLLLIYLAVLSTSAQAVVLWIDDWYNDSGSDYYFYKKEIINAGALRNVYGCSGGQPKANHYFKWCKKSHLQKAGMDGYAIPWIGTTESTFFLHRHGKGTVEMWVGSCESNASHDCLNARNSHSGASVDKFPISLGPKGTCPLTMYIRVESNHDVKFVHVDDKFHECDRNAKWTSKIADKLLDAAPALAEALL